MTPYDRAHAAMDADPENEALRLAVYLADAQQQTLDATTRLQRGGGGLGVGARCVAVVVQRQPAYAGIGEVVGDQRAEVLATAGDHGDLVFQCACGHSECSWSEETAGSAAERQIDLPDASDKYR